MIKLFGKSQILKADEVISVRRLLSVTYPSSGPNAGKPVQQAPQNFTVRGNVQPLTGRDLLMVPEHDRYREQYWLWVENTKYAVQSGLNDESVPILKTNDIVIRLGVNFQIQEVQDWGTYIRGHMMRVDVGPYATPGGQNSQ